jgi:hypothetical protein
MIKKHQKWTALLVAITFAWLLQVSAMPLAANNKTEAVAASAGQAPGFVEQQGPDWNRPAKLKITTVLIIVGALLVLGIITVFFRGIGHEAASREGTNISAARRSPIAIR